MQQTKSERPRSETQSKRGSPPRSSPPSGAGPPRSDGEVSGAVAYLNLFGPPALASTSDTFFQAVAVLQAILKGTPKHHAHAIREAADVVAESHVERSLVAGGQER